jgi:hypothetical protein
VPVKARGLEKGHDLMDQRSLSPQTLAAQGLGEADPATGGLAPIQAVYLRLYTPISTL